MENFHQIPSHAVPANSFLLEIRIQTNNFIAEKKRFVANNKFAFMN